MRPNDEHAFPTLFIEPEHGSGYAGMTLRDYFAAAALPTALNGIGSQGIECLVSPVAKNEEDQAFYAAAVAEGAYRIADAMLAERRKR